MNARRHGQFESASLSLTNLPKLDLDKIIPAVSIPNKTSKVGRVVSTKNSKTIVVAVRHDFQHPKYKRIVRKTKRFHVHDEFELARDGDLVQIVSCRPMSKLKKWNLVEVVSSSRVKPIAWPSTVDRTFS